MQYTKWVIVKIDHAVKLQNTVKNELIITLSIFQKVVPFNYDKNQVMASKPQDLKYQ